MKLTFDIVTPKPSPAGSAVELTDDGVDFVARAIAEFHEQAALRANAFSRPERSWFAHESTCEHDAPTQAMGRYGQWHSAVRQERRNRANQSEPGGLATGLE